MGNNLTNHVGNYVTVHKNVKTPSTGAESNCPSHADGFIPIDLP